MKKVLYFCTVFFMVLDLRLSEDWAVGMTVYLFFIPFCSILRNIFMYSSAWI